MGLPAASLPAQLQKAAGQGVGSRCLAISSLDGLPAACCGSRLPAELGSMGSCAFTSCVESWGEGG